MSIPRERHERIGEREEGDGDDGFHVNVVREGSVVNGEWSVVSGQ